jgi:hypothetical protein
MIRSATVMFKQVPKIATSSNHGAVMVMHLVHMSRTFRGMAPFWAWKPGQALMEGG